MPVISNVKGVKISMFYNDHNPPHIHIELAEEKALYDIKNNMIIEGKFTNKKLEDVKEWTIKNKEALLENWQLAREGKQLKKIKGV